MTQRIELLIYGAVPAVLGAIGIVFLKRAGRHFSSFSLDGIVVGFQKAFLSLDIWVGLALYVMAFAWLMVVISRVDVSRFYPVAVGLNIVFVTLGGLVLLHEGLPFTKALGILLVIAGVFFVSV